jgi:hypothetical protein
VNVLLNVQKNGILVQFKPIRPPDGIPTLMKWRGFCGHMNPKVLLVVAYGTGRASHARQVKGDDPDEKQYPGPPGWGLGVGLTTPHCENNVPKPITQPRKDEK